MEYRSARRALAAFNDKEHGMAVMGANPWMADLLREMREAQGGE